MNFTRLRYKCVLLSPFALFGVTNNPTPPPLTVHKEVCRTSPFIPQENLCINPPDTTGPEASGRGGEGPGEGLLGPRPHFRLLTSSSFSRTWDLLKKLQTLKKDMDMPNYTPTAAVWTLWLYINRHIDISINGYS